MEKFGKGVFNVCLMLLCVVTSVIAFKSLYTWFLVPLGAPVVSYLQAYGVLMVAAFLKFRVKQDITDSEKTPFGITCGLIILFNLIALLMGYVLSLFL